MSSAGRPPPRAARFPLPLAQVGRHPACAPASSPPSASTPAPSPANSLLRPQRLLSDAARDARARQAPPLGLGLDSATVRARMVQRLQADGLRCEPVAAALREVQRHRFVDSALAIQAYEDTSLPIGLGQTISKPSVVARMLALLLEGRTARRLGHLGRVLEVGTGCGYQAALLARLASQVVSIERLAPLHAKARAHLAELRLDHVRLVHGDGMLGHAPNAPYDTIIAAAGGQALPAAWLDQLAVGGRLVAPLQRDGGGRHAGAQVLVVLDRDESGLLRTELEAVQFVPLKSGYA